MKLLCLSDLRLRQGICARGKSRRPWTDFIRFVIGELHLCSGLAVEEEEMNEAFPNVSVGDVIPQTISEASPTEQ